ncbi:hypothetical protein D3C80_1652400 [compost metagenome]
MELSVCRLPRSNQIFQHFMLGVDGDCPIGQFGQIDPVLLAAKCQPDAMVLRPFCAHTLTQPGLIE